MGRTRIRTRDVIILLFVLLIGVGAGFILGEVHAISLFTKLGVNVLQSQGINLTISAEEIARGIFQYQNRI